MLPSSATLATAARYGPGRGNGGEVMRCGTKGTAPRGMGRTKGRSHPRLLGRRVPISRPGSDALRRPASSGRHARPAYPTRPTVARRVRRERSRIQTSAICGRPRPCMHARPHVVVSIHFAGVTVAGGGGGPHNPQACVSRDKE